MITCDLIEGGCGQGEKYAFVVSDYNSTGNKVPFGTLICKTNPGVTGGYVYMFTAYPRYGFSCIAYDFKEIVDQIDSHWKLYNKHCL